MAGDRAPRADIVMGVLLFVLAVAVIYRAWTMDRLEVRQIHPASVPGLTPGLLGIALGVASLLLLASGLRPQTSVRPAPGDAGPELPADPGALQRLLVAGALCLVYALGLIGSMPFWLATALFVTTFIAVFEWERGGDPGRRLRRLAWALALGLGTGLAVSYGFSDIFLVRLP
jgi:putative tricarboxylic transport membrane protein